MNKQFLKPTNVVNTDDAINQAVHSVELEGGHVSQSARDLMKKVATGEITGEEYRATILAAAGVTKVR